jgi:DNA-binding LacI/PurR family transcriptional regulator
MADTRPRRRAGLSDVARLAGVSVRTVSNVVNGFPHVSEATRARVRQALDELDYRPNLAARSLRTGRSGMIGLAVPVVDHSYFSELARAIVRAGDRHSYTVLIEQTDSVPRRESHFFSGVGSHLIDGLILSPSGLSTDELDKLRGATPLVLLGEQISGRVADHVAIDNIAAARVATAHLLELGRRRIAAIGCGQHSGSAAERLRYQGYEAALVEAGIAVDADLVIPREVLPDRRAGASAMERLLESEQPPDAVFCFNDLIALGAIRTLLSRGYRVPDEVAVAGIDDIEDGRFSTPSLTTISPDKTQIADTAFDLLVSRIESGTSEAPREIEADFTLIVRESTVARRRDP